MNDELQVEMSSDGPPMSPLASKKVFGYLIKYDATINLVFLSGPVILALCMLSGLIAVGILVSKYDTCLDFI